MPPTSTGVAEWALIAVSSVSFLFHVWRFRDAEIDLIRLRDAGRNGALRRVAFGNRRREGVRIAVQLLLIGVGVFLILLPDRGSELDGRLAVAATLLLDAIAVLLLANSWADQQDRQYILKRPQEFQQEVIQ